MDSEQTSQGGRWVFRICDLDAASNIRQQMDNILKVSVHTCGHLSPYCDRDLRKVQENTKLETKIVKIEGLCDLCRVQQGQERQNAGSQTREAQQTTTPLIDSMNPGTDVGQSAMAANMREQYEEFENRLRCRGLTLGQGPFDRPTPEEIQLEARILGPLLAMENELPGSRRHVSLFMDDTLDLSSVVNAPSYPTESTFPPFNAGPVTVPELGCPVFTSLFSNQDATLPSRYVNPREFLMDPLPFGDPQIGGDAMPIDHLLTYPPSLATEDLVVDKTIIDNAQPKASRILSRAPKPVPQGVISVEVPPPPSQKGKRQRQKKGENPKGSNQSPSQRGQKSKASSPASAKRRGRKKTITDEQTSTAELVQSNNELKSAIHQPHGSDTGQNLVAGPPATPDAARTLVLTHRKRSYRTPVDSPSNKRSRYATPAESLPNENLFDSPISSLSDLTVKGNLDSSSPTNNDAPTQIHDQSLSQTRYPTALRRSERTRKTTKKYNFE